MLNYIKSRRSLISSILIIAAPAVAEMALVTMLGFADTLMISRLIGENALSAVGIVNSIINLLIFVFSAFNTGAIALISRSYGERDMKKAEEIAGNNLTLNLIIGIGVMIGALLARNVFFSFYDITDAVLTEAYAYYNIIVYGLLFQFGSFAFAAISRGVADTKTPMYITGLVNIFNIVFNYLLIKGVWIFPEMGIRGAALATTIARGVAFLIYVYVFISGKHKIQVKLQLLKLKRSLTKSLWKISLPGGLEQLLMQGAFLLMGVLITILDTTSEALFRILIAIESISFMPAVGLSIAAATLVGKALGEKKIDKASDSGYLATGMGAVWGIIAGLIFFLFPRFFLGLFTEDQQLIELGRSVFYVMGVNQLFLNTYIVMSGALRGAGDTRGVMVITSLRLWTIFLPGAYLLIRFTSLGVSSVWYAEIVSFFIFLLFLLKRFHSKKWAKIQV